MPNKVKFNIHNVHYAVKNSEDSSYGTPVAIPGAVSLSLEQQGELSPFWADGIKYYVSASNGGYEGDLEVALIPDKFRTDVLGEVTDNNNVLIEKANIPTVEFALGFEVDGDVGSTLFWFYNCSATRPSIDATTNEDTKEPNTDTLTVSCSSNAAGVVRAKTTATTSEDIKNDWFTAVYIQDQENTGAGA